RWRPPWCRFSWRRSSFPILACSGARGSRAERTNEGASRGLARDGVSRVAAAALGDPVPAAGCVSLRAALSVLLDGDDLVQAGRGAAQPRGQPVLDPPSDLRALR